jgi:hypothetical protein
MCGPPVLGRGLRWKQRSFAKLHQAAAINEWQELGQCKTTLSDWYWVIAARDGLAKTPASPRSSDLDRYRLSA